MPNEVTIKEVRLLVRPNPDKMAFPTNLLPRGLREKLSVANEKISYRVRAGGQDGYDIKQALDIARNGGGFEGKDGEYEENGKSVIGRVALIVTDSKNLTIDC